MDAMFNPSLRIATVLPASPRLEFNPWGPECDRQGHAVAELELRDSEQYQDPKSYAEASAQLRAVSVVVEQRPFSFVEFLDIPLSSA